MSNESNDSGKFVQPNFASDKWTQDYIAATGNGPLKASGKGAINPEAVPNKEQPHTGWTAEKLSEVGLFTPEDWDSSLPVEEFGSIDIEALRKQAFDKFANELRSRGVTESEIAFYASLNGIEGYPIPETGVTLSMDRKQFDSAMASAMHKLEPGATEDRPRVPRYVAPELGYNPEPFIKLGKEISKAVTQAQEALSKMGYGIASGINDGVSDEPLWTEAELQRKERFMQTCEMACTLYMMKNREYRNAVKHTGAVGSAIVMTGDIAKLRSILLYRLDSLDSIDADNASDKFQDVLVQAVVGIMMLEDGNIVGEDAGEI